MVPVSEGSTGASRGDTPAYGWYVSKVKRGKVSQAQVMMELNCLETYYPRIAIKRQSHTRWEALFPDYLFCHLNPGSSSHWPQVLWTPCFRYFLPQEGPPAPLSDETMEALRQRVARWNSGGYQDVFHQGDRVRFRSGALQGLEAIFERYLPARERCEAFLNWFGRELRTVVSVSEVELVPRAASQRPWVLAYRRLEGLASQQHDSTDR